MKRIVSFLILSVLFVVILMLPAGEAPAAVQHDPLPMWSILCYLMTVVIAGTVGVAIRSGEPEPVMA